MASCQAGDGPSDLSRHDVKRFGKIQAHRWAPAQARHAHRPPTSYLHTPLALLPLHRTHDDAHTSSFAAAAIGSQLNFPTCHSGGSQLATLTVLWAQFARAVCLFPRRLFLCHRRGLSPFFLTIGFMGIDMGIQDFGKREKRDQRLCLLCVTSYHYFPFLML
jgi:hypothetical protein